MLIKRNNKEQYSINLTTKALESHTGKPVQLKIQLKSRNIQNRIDVYNLQLTSNHPELQFRHHSFDLARNIFYRVLNVPYVATQLEPIYIYYSCRKPYTKCQLSNILIIYLIVI